MNVVDERLQKFARLVEVGSFTRAAQDLHLSQPALTLAINKLERELSISLLVRGNRKLELTDAGRVAYAAAVEHRVANENLLTSLVELAGKRPRVAIGMIDSVAATLSDAAQALDKLEAAADVSIVVNNSRYLREAVTNRKLDLAFVVGSPAENQVENPGFEIKQAGTELLVAVCLPGRIGVVQEELATGSLLQFISYDQLSATYQHIEQQLQKAKIKPHPVFYSTSPDVMLRMVLRGRGVAVLPYLLTRDLLVAGKLAALKKNGRAIVIDRPVSMLKPRGKTLPAALLTFADQARETLGSIRADYSERTA